jgi:hypothetical protein
VIPPPLKRVADLMATYRRPWFLCGGWAVDAWLGHQTREHGDVDIAVFQDDQQALYQHLTGWDLVAHDPAVADDSTEKWNGRQLALPAHIHANIDAMHGVELDIQLNECTDDAWIYRREPRIAMQLKQQTGGSAWALPTVPPELVLLYKAHNPDSPLDYSAFRPNDDLDFRTLRPTLTEKQQSWLYAALTLVDPAHPWLARFPR